MCSGSKPERKIVFVGNTHLRDGPKICSESMVFLISFTFDVEFEGKSGVVIAEMFVIAALTIDAEVVVVVEEVVEVGGMNEVLRLDQV